MTKHLFYFIPNEWLENLPEQWMIDLKKEFVDPYRYAGYRSFRGQTILVWFAFNKKKLFCVEL